MTDSTDPAIAARSIQNLGPKSVIIKLGSRGCYMAVPGLNDYVNSYRVESVLDPTGAGDAFCGGYLFAVMEGLDAVSAAKIGHAAANHVIRQPGAHAGAPTLTQLVNFLRQKGELSLAAGLTAPIATG